MSLTTELEELLKEKAQLQKILQSIEEEEKYQEKRLRIFEEQMSIQVLNEKIKAKRAVVEQLKSKMWNLEKGLKELTRETRTFPNATDTETKSRGEGGRTTTERAYGSDCKRGSRWQPTTQTI